MALSHNQSDVTAAAPAFDSLLTVPEYEPLRASLAARDWQAVEDVLSAFTPPEEAYALWMLADLDGVDDLLEEWVRDRPRSAAGATARGMRSTRVGWAVRTHAQYEQLSKEQIEGFRAWIENAEQQLISACAIDPSYAPAWSARVVTARALELGSAEALRRFARVSRISPDDYPAAAQMLQYLLPKWHGTAAEAGAFVRERVAAAPPGSPMGALVPVLHIEAWAELGAEGQAHLAHPDVSREIDEAAARSVLHPDFVAGPIGVEALGAFALAGLLADRRDEAARFLRMLDGRASEFPWIYAVDDAAHLDRIRVELGVPVANEQPR